MDLRVAKANGMPVSPAHTSPRRNCHRYLGRRYLSASAERTYRVRLAFRYLSQSPAGFFVNAASPSLTRVAPRESPLVPKDRGAFLLTAVGAIYGQEETPHPYRRPPHRPA